MELAFIIIGEIVTILSLIIGALGLKRSIRKDRDAKIASDAVLTTEVKHLKSKLDSETGGNSNGLRQAINTTNNLIKTIQGVQKDIQEIQKLEAAKSDTVSHLVHELSGQMREHSELHRRGAA